MTAHTLEKAPNLLTPEMAGDVVFYTFRYSQGDTYLQFHLMELVKYLRPDWRMSQEVEAYLQSEAFEKRIVSFAASKAHYPTKLNPLLVLRGDGVKPFT